MGLLERCEISPFGETSFLLGHGREDIRPGSESSCRAQLFVCLQLLLLFLRSIPLDIGVSTERNLVTTKLDYNIPPPLEALYGRYQFVYPPEELSKSALQETKI